MLRVFLFLALVIAPLGAAAPAEGERIALVGNGLGESFLDHPWFEAELHLRHSDASLVVRNLCRLGDTPGLRPHPSRSTPWAFPGAEAFHPEHRIHRGQGHHPSPDEWLTEVKADTILAFFGYNESFAGPEGLDRFRGELEAFIGHTLKQRYNGTTPPRLVLVSPIAFEGLPGHQPLRDGADRNDNLKLYTDAMRNVAAVRNVGFIDLFTPTLGKSGLTVNGFLPGDEGCRFLAPFLADGLYGESPHRAEVEADELLGLLRDRNWHWFHLYQMPNGVHTDGRRYKPFGPQNYPAESERLRGMIANREAKLRAFVNGGDFDLAAADAALPALPPVPTNYGLGRMKKQDDANSELPEVAYLYGEEAEASFKTPEDFEARLFASERGFPNLANPAQMSFDNRGRLWVATMPSYPHWRPGDPRPDDKLLIYEDTDGDGRADKETVFADGLHLPIGFELAPEGVYLSQAPDLVLLRDTDGDDRADRSELLLTGFDTHDTHHAISAFTADPTGALLMGEGIFLHSNVETTYGPVRGVDGGFFRFDPRTHRLTRHAQVEIPNPWGIAVDRWGQEFFLHTSGPQLNWMLPVSLRTPQGQKNPHTVDLIPKGHAVRPTSGLEFVSSRHFPPDQQGDLILGNNIGFLGIKQHALADDGTGYATRHRQDLLVSSDPNFRPVDMEFAPDGSLFVVDWHNALIGHMQHNARDPLRDHSHGRIVRITHRTRPLVEPAPIAGAPVADLLENLASPESRTAYRTRRELRGRAPEDVLPALKTWAAAQDDPRLKLEALWVSTGLGKPDVALLRELLVHEDPRARAAALHVLRHEPALFGAEELEKLLAKAMTDPHGRVRLEALVSATWLPDQTAKPLVELALKQELDPWTKAPTLAAARRLGFDVEAEVGPTAPPAPEGWWQAEAERFTKGWEIYGREGFCGTCHQPDGKGLPDAGFPPLAGSEWVTGDPERLIKITLHGLIGPIEVAGRSYPGQVPMTPFGGLLDDEEIAAVLSYVRHSFGNTAWAITPEEVARVRKETGTRAFYTADELKIGDR